MEVLIDKSKTPNRLKIAPRLEGAGGRQLFEKHLT